MSLDALKLQKSQIFENCASFLRKNSLGEFTFPWQSFATIFTLFSAVDANSRKNLCLIVMILSERGLQKHVPVRTARNTLHL